MKEIEKECEVLSYTQAMNTKKDLTKCRGVPWFFCLGTHRKQNENERPRGAKVVCGHTPQRFLFLGPRKCHFPCFQGRIVINRNMKKR